MNIYNRELPELSNPRKFAEFDNWPFGRNRVKCQFEVESNKRGERVLRRTENKTRTGWNKDKKTTYATHFVIADGDDSKTYLISYNKDYNNIVIWNSDLTTHSYQHGEDIDPAKWEMLLNLCHGGL